MNQILVPPKIPIWVTSDLHYGHHNIIKYCKRPWLSEEERHKIEIGEDFKVSKETTEAHDAALTDNINSCVGINDWLLIIGDVAFDIKKVKELRERLNVKHVIIVLGNHDDEVILRQYFPNCFERALLSVDYGGKIEQAVLDHYPGDSWYKSHHGMPLCFGHSHGAGEKRRLANPSWLLSQDCGVDLHDFKPWHFQDELLPLFASRKANWYDWRQRFFPPREKGGMSPEVVYLPQKAAPAYTY